MQEGWNNMIRILMVEDNDADARRLSQHLERYGAEHGKGLSVKRLRSALEFAEARPAADLILMDIDMPGMTGMEAAQVLREDDSVTPLVFVTSLAQYAVEGYQVDAIDFMVKPVAYEDFSARMDRAMRRVAHNAGHTIAVSNRQETRLVDLADLSYVEARNHDLIYHLSDGSELKARGKLAALEQELANSPFARFSKSVIANLAHVRRVQGDEVEMDGGGSAWLSRSCKKSALEAIAKYLGGTR